MSPLTLSLIIPPLHVDKLMGLFEKRVFSDEGTSELAKEQSTYIHFSDLLEELEGIYMMCKYKFGTN